MGDAFRDTAGLAVLAAFAIGICAAMVEARRRREETEDLLGELEAAHAELERYAERVKELTVAEERARMSSGDARLPGPLPDRDQRGFAERPEVQGEEARGSLGRGRGSQEPDPGGALGGQTLGAGAQAARTEDRAAPEAMAALARSFEGTGFDVRFAVEGSERSSRAKPSWSSTAPCKKV